MLFRPSCAERVVAILRADGGSRRNPEEQDTLLRFAGRITSGIWEHFDIKSVFVSKGVLPASSEALFLCDMVDLLSRIVTPAGVCATRSKICAELLETGFLLALLSAKLDIARFEAVIEAFSLAEPADFISAAKRFFFSFSEPYYDRYARFAQLQASQPSGVTLAPQIIAVLMRRFARFYVQLVIELIGKHGHKEAAFVDASDFAMKLIKLQRSLKCGGGGDTSEFALRMLSSQSEACKVCDLPAAALHVLSTAIFCSGALPRDAVTGFTSGCIQCEDLAARVFALDPERADQVAKEGFSTVSRTASSLWALRARLPTGIAEVETEAEKLIAQLPITEIKTEAYLSLSLSMIDVRLAEIRESTQQEKDHSRKYVALFSPSMHQSHRHVSGLAMNMFRVLAQSLREMTGTEFTGEESFKEFYTRTLGDSSAMHTISGRLSTTGLSMMCMAIKYGTESMNVLRYFGLFREAQALAEYAVLVQHFVKTAVRSSAAFYRVMLHRYVQFMHELLAGYCDMKDGKSLREFLPYLAKCNEHYKEVLGQPIDPQVLALLPQEVVDDFSVRHASVNPK